MRTGSKFKWRHWEGYLFILPWIIGFFCFAVGPLIASMRLSVVEWDMLPNSVPKYVGMANYQALFQDEDFWVSLRKTALYVAMAVPVTMVGSLAVAMLLNQKVPGITVFRTIYYLPAVTSGVAMLMLWRLLFRPDTGVADWLLQHVWLPGYTAKDGFGLFPILAQSPNGPGFLKESLGWLSSEAWAMPTLVLLSLWGLGSGMIIYLAGLQGIPEHLYEAAELDGAGAWRKFLNVTLPMLTPTIFFNLVMNTIGAFQAFDQAYILSGGFGAPGKSLLMYVLYLYNQAFMYLKIGSASAMAWVLFVIILILTGLNFLFSKRWVHYD